jgi:NADH:ubiquinone oxidoreductase subunit F (NADH-binding)/(2Fe-2S) ferredoxin/NAD-dependent dihydropyrimidine dehydrogenase PreA subunit
MGKIITTYEKIMETVKKGKTAENLDNKIVIQVGNATCENAAGARDVEREFRKLVSASGRTDIVIKQTACTGRCAAEPIVSVYLPHKSPLKYEMVTTEKVNRIFLETCLNQKLVVDYILDKKTSNIYTHLITFFSSNVRRNGKDFDRVAYCRSRLDECGTGCGNVKISHGSGFGFRDEIGENRHYAIVYPEHVFYKADTKEEIDRIIKEHVQGGRVVKDLEITKSFLAERFFETYGDVPFFNKQTRLTLRNSGIIDPESIDDYIYYDGFKALCQVLDSMKPVNVIDEMKKSGLRGRGGGGFSVGLKWDLTAREQNAQKYMICNADEGDPGAFMDRSTLEGDPYSVIEGLIIGAYATGASKAYFYIRAEYPLAIERIEKALAKTREYGFLGRNIAGSDFSLDIEVRLGAGAFVCGEETALIRSIEGKRGQPRFKPPFPSVRGLWDCPTTVNNVETLANVPVVILYGSTWFASIGTPKSTGTKVFALAGDIRNTGLVEVPMGTTLREIIYDIGGGIPDDKNIKAIQTGGPSGGCIPADKIDTIVDYDSLISAGSFMGSGGMIVLNEDACMVDVAKFFLQFTKDESCGKCTPCREGTVRMLEILERITEGKGTEEDLDKLERLGRTIMKSSLCGLGQSAPKPVLSNLANFRGEFLAHVRDKRCPSRKCTKLLRYVIIPETCIGCTACARNCPVNCIAGKAKQVHVIDQERCIKCGQCYTVCKFAAVGKE